MRASRRWLNDVTWKNIKIATSLFKYLLNGIKYYIFCIFHFKKRKTFFRLTIVLHYIFLRMFWTSYLVYLLRTSSILYEQLRLEPLPWLGAQNRQKRIETIYLLVILMFKSVLVDQNQNLKVLARKNNLLL